jgi:hypothetical protein
MAVDKNQNLAQTIIGIAYMYPTTPIAIRQGADAFHKLIILPLGASFTPLYFTPGTGEFVEKMKSEDAGIVFEQTLKCSVPGEDDTSLAFKDAISDRPLLLRITFQNGTKKLMGLPENPARITDTTQFSAKVSASEFTFTCNAQARAWWIIYEGPDVPI